MPTARFERTYHLSATHHYRRDDWDAARNRAAFGDLAEPHEHDWTITLCTRGRMAEVTGFSVDLAALDALAAEVIGGWRGADLNVVVPPVAAGEMLPSCEALARWLFGVFARRLPEGVELLFVRVAESDEIAAVFAAGDEA
jgi:6-pyruvoyl-tetrahydropterin synthase